MYAKSMQIHLNILNSKKMKITQFLDMRSQLKDGTFPVKLRITNKGKQKYYSLNRFLNKEDWDKIKSGTRKAPLVKIQEYLDKEESKARTIIDKLRPYSEYEFEKQYLGRSINSSSVFELADIYIEDKIKSDSIRTAQSMEDMKSSMGKYLVSIKQREFKFESITVEWLRGYENWMVKRGNSLTTAGMYLRNLRTLFNTAIRTEIVNKANYPFERHKYIIPKGNSQKNVPTEDDIKALLKYRSDNHKKQRSRDFFILSYLCSGVNLADLVRMRPEYIKENCIHFPLRMKTRNSNKESLTIPLLSQAMEIIERYKKTNAYYVFDIINPEEKEKTKIDKIKQFNKVLNEGLESICVELGMKKYTYYTARHAFASHMIRKGVPLMYIKEQMAHTDIKTTMIYVGSLDKKNMHNLQQNLLE
jgi:integrase/recombinase XerD